MSDEIRRLSNEVRANYMVLETGLTALSHEFQEHAKETRAGMQTVRQGLDEVRQGLDETRQGLNEVRQGLDEVRQGLDEVRQGLDETRQGLDSTQESVARLASQQDAHAARVADRFVEMIDASRAVRTSAEAALDLVAQRYEDIEDIQRRLADLEGWRDRQAG